MNFPVTLVLMMPEWSRFDLASQLELGKGETKVVFVSNHESMVFDSYDYSPLWFVRKSMLKKDMLRALQKYEQITARKKISYWIWEGRDGKRWRKQWADMEGGA